MPARSLDAHPRATALTARDLSKAYGDRVVLDGVDLTATPGVPLGVVGENGSGKSTLLRLLAGEDRPDAGDVVRPPDLGHLPQHPGFRAGATVADVLDGALAPLHHAAGRLARLGEALASSDDPARADEYADLLGWCVLHDVWDADRRTAEAAARLGLAAVDRATPVAALSGGERSRLALAALVVRRPACLLLDEPTNHLDDDATDFLEGLVATLPGVVVVASHDRTFLQKACRRLLDVDPALPTGSGRSLVGARFTGTYTDFLAAKAAERRRWVEAYEAQCQELDRLRSTAATTARRVAPGRPPRDNDKFVHHAKGQNVARTVRRRVRDAERRIDSLEAARVPRPPRPLSL
ncbi:MAG TPA: ATP-binding cassette domain-containing protein, partial [Nocardioides sp.]|nr:ATP-binding cassette domain-containing protein [Nocardioides sp.]